MNFSKDERGSISIATAVFAGAMFALALAVIAHSQYINSYTRTREAASNAARVGAQEIDETILLNSGQVQINEVDAERAVRQHLSQYENIKIDSISFLGDSVVVTVSETVKPIRGLTRNISATGTAAAIDENG